ncbi:MAG: bacteriocin secretion accessory protein [Streptococcaceae bacterium]|jgi:competence factor transport accessory protein ComB|nr:bacteriocin secretion accessory protein [Streptococcaceae bacterium]
MDKRLLESTEFYHRRYQNFSTLIIFPILLLLVFILIFSFIGKKELVMKSSAEIMPTKIVERLQSSSDNDIIENYLKENRMVEKRETLLVYNHDQDKTQLDLLTHQLESTKQQLEQIQRLKRGIENGEKTFEGEDAFGYSQMLAAYFAQVKEVKQDAAKENQTIGNQNATIEATKQAIDLAISENDGKLAAYQELKHAISNNTQLPANHSLSAMHATYVNQLKEQSEQKEGLKNQFLVEIETNIQQLQSAATSLNTQKAGAGAIVSKSTSLQSRLEAFKAEKLANLNQEITTLEATKKELEAKLNLETQELSRSILVTKEAGILHINDEIVGMKKIPSGTMVAEVYPSLQENTKIHLVFYIPTTDVLGLKKGQEVRMNNAQKTSEALLLTGRISEIASSPTRTKEGNFYKVIAEVALSRVQAVRSRYGLQGKVTIITGKKTFFNYYKDKIFNNE